MPSAQPTRRRGNVVAATAGNPVPVAQDDNLRTTVMDYVHNGVIDHGNVENLLESFPPLDPKEALKVMKEWNNDDLNVEGVVTRILDGRSDHQEIINWINHETGPKQIVIVIDLHGEDAHVPEYEREDNPTLDAYWKALIEDNMSFDDERSTIRSITSKPLAG